ncbi:MAG: GH3 auxin-responsive promoter family protein [Firmicutes bacterium]|nr:GH3 auxin-responsive promoter family protein [Bacillota bacterium]
MDEKTKMINKQILDAMTEASYKTLHSLDMASIRAVEAQNELLETLLNDNSDTEYGKKYDFANIHNADEYRKKLPLTTYDDYEEYIDRMVDNDEKGLITNYPVVYYASTSGTSGEPKKIPITDKGMSVFRAFTGQFMH